MKTLPLFLLAIILLNACKKAEPSMHAPKPVPVKYDASDPLNTIPKNWLGDIHHVFRSPNGDVDSMIVGYSVDFVYNSKDSSYSFYVTNANDTFRHFFYQMGKVIGVIASEEHADVYFMSATCHDQSMHYYKAQDSIVLIDERICGIERSNFYFYSNKH